jgi:hypothetical protein
MLSPRIFAGREDFLVMRFRRLAALLCFHPEFAQGAKISWSCASGGLPRCYAFTQNLRRARRFLGHALPAACRAVQWWERHR